MYPPAPTSAKEVYTAESDEVQWLEGTERPSFYIRERPQICLDDQFLLLEIEVFFKYGLRNRNISKKNISFIAKKNG